ncbi:MAG: c-type cytochrome [Bacteroidota bacterium]
MKKVLKYLGILVGVIVVIALCAALFIQIRGIPSYEVETTEFQLNSTPQSVERGKKLALMLCANCHKNPETGKLTGTQMTEAPPEFGFVYSQNITQDKEYGIGNYTPAELVYLIRTGIKKDGHYSPPWMAKLPSMADEDINAIVSFLKSNDPLVAADATPDLPCKPSFLTKFLTHVAFKPLPMPEKRIEMPDTNNKVELGKYLAYNLECFSCHSADYKTNDYLHPELSVGFFGGGNKPLNKEGQVMQTPNLTPDAETGIGSWTPEKFLKAVKYGLKEGEAGLRFPMTPYAYLTDDEVNSIYLYLRTIPAIKNKIKRENV